MSGKGAILLLNRVSTHWPWPRGVCRCLCQLGYAVLSEFRLPNGRRADIVAIDVKGLVTIVEIKSSVEDFRSDKKWSEYLPFCDAFYFAISDRFPTALIPDTCGLLVADSYGAAIVRAAPSTPLDAARRRLVTLRFALTAARRLHRDRRSSRDGRSRL